MSELDYDRFNDRSDKRAAKQGETDILMNNMHCRREHESTSMPLLPAWNPLTRNALSAAIMKTSRSFHGTRYNISEYKVYRELAMLSVLFICLGDCPDGDWIAGMRQ